MERGRAPGVANQARCRICGRGLTPLEARSGEVCGDWRCREAVLARAAAEERARAVAALSSHRADRSDDRASAPTVVVPWRRNALRPLPAGRRREFLTHLDALLAEVVEGARTGAERAGLDPGRPGGVEPGDGAAPPGMGAPRGACDEGATLTDAAEVGGDPEAPIDPLLARVCAACQGACCHAGGTRAFLDTVRIAEVLTRIGDLLEVRAAYERLLPERSVGGSCVFHGSEGCGLPRELRSETCNRYECRGFVQAREHREAGAELVHVVRREDQSIHDSAFVDAERLERARRRPRRPARTDRR